MILARIARGAMLAGLLVAGILSLGGCQRTLFGDSDSYMRSRLDRYYDGDSATEMRAKRLQSTEMGFGFPTGMANQ